MRALLLLLVIAVFCQVAHVPFVVVLDALGMMARALLAVAVGLLRAAVHA